MEWLSEFAAWVAGRTFGKLALFAVVALPVLAVVGYFSGLGRSKKGGES
jgi:hypothetical protein